MATAHERLSKIGQGPNAPQVCPRCGGTFFQVDEVRQLGSGGYGSTQFRPIGHQSFQVSTCLCGHRIFSQVVGSTTEGTAFTKSVRAAETYLKNNNPNEFIKTLVTLKELEAVKADLAARIIDVNDRIELLKVVPTSTPSADVSAPPSSSDTPVQSPSVDQPPSESATDPEPPHSSKVERTGAETLGAPAKQSTKGKHARN